MNRAFSLFGLGLSLFGLAFNLYAANWICRRLKPGPAGRFITAEAALLWSALYPAARLWSQRLPGPLAAGALWLGFFAFGASFIAAWWLALCDLLLWSARSRSRGAALACLAGALFLVGMAAEEGRRPPQVVRVEVQVKGLPAELDGFSVMQVSDLHLGRMNGLDRLEQIAVSARELKPDLLVFTGDFSERRERMPDGTCSVLSGMEARYGKAAALGNHDMFSGDGQPAAEFFEGCGVKVLRGAVYEPVKGLQVAGVDDLRRAPDGARRLVPLLDRSKPLIFLSHQPDGFDEVTAAGSGLALSGHTHGGQIFPFSLLERWTFRHFYGLYKERDFHIYVTSGAGIWGPPLRLFTRSELPLLVLRRAR